MNRIVSYTLSLVLLIGFVILSSCQEDPELPDNLVEFESDELGISSSETELTITINLSREASAEASLIVNVEPVGLAYDVDFTTEPATISNSISIPVAVSATTASFVVKKSEGALFDGDEKITFTIASAPESLVLGEKTQLTLKFAEIVATTGAMELNGGGPTYPNKVFIDLSANRQTAVARTTWDLGFSSGSDFRIVLNASNGMLARALDKTDLNSVTASDTVGWGTQLSLGAVFAAITSTPVPDWVPSAITWIDDPSGDLSKTSIPAISATPSENKVYIINRGDGPGTPATKLGWKKIRIVRNGNGYTLQHADISATTFSEIQITKNTAYAFQFVSFATGVVEIEPTVDRWDLAWTGFTNSTNFGSGPVPYYFQDIILQNTTGIQTAQILTSIKTYESFGEADLASLDFGNQSQVKIGSSWRSGGGPGVSPAVRTDRFYIIKDSDNNFYKLRFTALTTSGERGKPKLEYSLIKKGT
ncbi:MAG: hypothetical protein JNJ65_14225 [Cyclobacteriaceae bacterium]|nr:hypothetical protein [Cyclobacteriaceae bacterium]